MSRIWDWPARSAMPQSVRKQGESQARDHGRHGPGKILRVLPQRERGLFDKKFLIKRDWHKVSQCSIDKRQYFGVVRMVENIAGKILPYNQLHQRISGEILFFEEARKRSDSPIFHFRQGFSFFVGCTGENRQWRHYVWTPRGKDGDFQVWFFRKSFTSGQPDVLSHL